MRGWQPPTSRKPALTFKMLFSELLLISLQYYTTLEGSIKFIKYMRKPSEFILILLKRAFAILPSKALKAPDQSMSSETLQLQTPIIVQPHWTEAWLFISTTVVRAEQGGGNFSWHLSKEKTSITTMFFICNLISCVW